MFFNYTQDIDSENPKPSIIEIGFLAFFILKKMQKNMMNDPDERYQTRIMNFIPFELNKLEDTKTGFLFNVWNFFIDIYISIKSNFKKAKTKIYIEDFYALNSNDSKIENILKFYSKWTSKVEVILNDKIQTIYFPKYPHCTRIDTTIREKFDLETDRTSAKTK